MQRQAIQPAAFCTNMMPKMAGVVTHRRNVTPRRGPRMSQMIPVQKRARMLAVPICGLVRLSEVFFFMYTISGAAANMEKNEEKKPHHDTWKARECGLLLSRMTNCTALCSASTGMENTRPKMSFSPRLFTPFFSRAACSLLTLSSSDSMVDSSCSSFSAVAMVVCAELCGP